MTMKTPKMYRLTQNFSRPLVRDASEATVAALKSLRVEGAIQRGQKIGITVGSRGIQNLNSILGAVIEFIRSCGATPILLAAMGSHGGGTRQGQREVLDSLGIREENLGAPVITSADCEKIGRTASGLDVFVLQPALAMDGILVLNRVKTHTSFKGKVESGLIKMLVVGLGGPKGAQQFHGFGPQELPRLLQEIGEVLLENIPVLGGLAIVENAYEETAVIRGIKRDGMIEAEGEMLLYSKSLMPSLPTDAIDLLIVEEMGKNFSGTGIDTNIIGRARIHGVPEPDSPSIQRIAVLDLSDESHGNATGVGMADFVTEKLVSKMDRQATYLNCLTSTFVVRAAIPMYFSTERQLLEAALLSLSGIEQEKLRIVIIPNTLFLTECYVSEVIANELRGRPGMEVADQGEKIEFQSDGALSLRM